MNRALCSWWSCRVFFLFCLTAAVAASAQRSFQTIVNFNNVNGDFATSTLVQGPDGDLYGTTQRGGAHAQGTVFRTTLAGKAKTLYSFCAQTNCSDGGIPMAGLVLGADGNFYGTTSQVGNNLGTIYKITTEGVLTTLHTFSGSDGSDPGSSLIQTSSGDFYGTTLTGGTNGLGTVFMMTSSGMLTTLHSFDKTDGDTPYAGLVLANDGNFYGTTFAGGSNNLGTIFRVTSSGTLTTVHNFDSTEGYSPLGGLLQASDGNLYGTTESGPSTTGRGTVFRMTLSGTLTTLHVFSQWNGLCPDAALIEASDGNLYGTTPEGGPPMYSFGGIFEITLAGKFTRIYSFGGGKPSGAMPRAALLQASDGNFYGTTESGGTGLTNNGTVFRLSLGL